MWVRAAKRRGQHRAGRECRSRSRRAIAYRVWSGFGVQVPQRATISGSRHGSRVALPALDVDPVAGGWRSEGAGARSHTPGPTIGPSVVRPVKSPSGLLVRPAARYDPPDTHWGDDASARAGLKPRRRSLGRTETGAAARYGRHEVLGPFACCWPTRVAVWTRPARSAVYGGKRSCLSTRSPDAEATGNSVFRSGGENARHSPAVVDLGVAYLLLWVWHRLRERGRRKGGHRARHTRAPAEDAHGRTGCHGYGADRGPCIRWLCKFLRDRARIRNGQRLSWCLPLAWLGRKSGLQGKVQGAMFERWLAGTHIHR